jgi:hypothetical protein
MQLVTGMWLFLAKYQFRLVLLQGHNAPEQGGSWRAARVGGGSVQGLVCSEGIFSRGSVHNFPPCGNYRPTVYHSTSLRTQKCIFKF